MSEISEDDWEGIAAIARSISQAITPDAMPFKDEFGVVNSLTEAVMRHGDQIHDGLMAIADALRNRDR